MPFLPELDTPCLLLDKAKMQRNIARMHNHIAALNGVLRPHGKSAKSIDVMHYVMDEHTSGITVSTVKEAEYFFANGIDDLLYAVGIAPNKLLRLAALIQRGAKITVIVDSIAQVERLTESAVRLGVVFPFLIEIDSDGHRAGVAPDDALLLEIATAAQEHAAVEFRGVITHAGASYDCRSLDEIRAMAEQERQAVVLAARRLVAAGFACPVVSLGSTPTAQFCTSLEGVTEVRTGVYQFHDLVMAGLGVCDIDDIALSVLATVIGHQREKNQLLVDAGWMALSRDRGTSRQVQDQGYGLVCDETGRVVGDLLVVATNQEHGMIESRDKIPLDWDAFPVGTLLRILPNHACATAAMFDTYHVLDDHGRIVAQWPRQNGW